MTLAYALALKLALMYLEVAFLCLFVKGLTTLCQLLQKMDSVRADETKPLVSSVNACIPSLKSAGKVISSCCFNYLRAQLLEEQKVAIPFLVLQKLQNDVDAFEAYLTKVHKVNS